MTIESPGAFWKDYELIDSGNFEKLERFGPYVMARPEPKALWDKSLSEGEWNKIGNFNVRCFVVPHDATQTVGYAIEADGHRFVIMTDVGRMTDEAVEFARNADSVVVESNYDIDMLMSGPYTYELKMRIVQGCGHLSNDECASAIRRFWHKGLKNIFLCHLSENNNTHDLAYKCSSEALADLSVEKGTVALRCLPRQYPSQMFTL